MAWEIVYPIGALILLAGIVWGLVQSHRRSRHMKQVTDVAAR